VKLKKWNYSGRPYPEDEFNPGEQNDDRRSYASVIFLIRNIDIKAQITCMLPGQKACLPVRLSISILTKAV